MSKLLDEGLQRLKDDLVVSLHVDIEAEITRFRLIGVKSFYELSLRSLDPLHGEISTLSGTISSLKSLCDDNIETVDNLQGFLGEVSEKININQQEVLTKIGNATKAISHLKDGISGLESQTGQVLQYIKDSKVKTYAELVRAKIWEIIQDFTSIFEVLDHFY